MEEIDLAALTAIAKAKELYNAPHNNNYVLDDPNMDLFYIEPNPNPYD